jgi:hypothetical protein
LLRHPDGEMSDDWKEALRIADEIAWAFEPKSKNESKELENTLPDLRKAIEEGLASLGGFHQEKSKGLFDLLTNAQVAMQASEVAANKVAEQPAVEAEPQPASPLPTATQATRPSQPAEISSAATAQPVTAGEGEVTEEEEAMMEKLRKIQFGTWFEIADSRGGERRKVKLSWLSPLTSSCMFVDRAGVQTAIKPLRTLAQEILSGQSTILEDSSDPFVERTLHAIRRMLQRSLKTTEDIASEIVNEDNEGTDVK